MASPEYPPPSCECESKAIDACFCARPKCFNVVCEAHGGVFDGDVDDEGFMVNASLCADCAGGDDDE